MPRRGWYVKRVGVFPSRIQNSTVVLSTAIGIISTVTEQSLRTPRENNTLFYFYRAHSFIFTATFSKVPRFAISLD